MPRYDVNKAQVEAMRYCRHGAPSLPVNIARHLQSQVSGFYPKSNPKDVVPFLKRDVLGPLDRRGFLIKYNRGSGPAWDKAVALAIGRARKDKQPIPRGLLELYQSNFLYLGDNSTMPWIHSLPMPPKETNLELNAFLSRFKKPSNFTWEMLNLLMCASEKRHRDDLRIHLYMLPLDYDEVELLERVLEYGEAYRGVNFPFKPSVDEAKGFLENMSSRN